MEPGEPTNPPESRICHKCGTEIPAGAEECSRCTLEAELKAKGFAVDLEALAAELPQLEILEEIGRGGMGVVFKARQKGLGRDVALKVLPKEFDYDTNVFSMKANDFSERFLRECQTLAGLSHPNIVTVYDSGMAGGHHFLLMEFVDGTDLSKLMKLGDVQSNQALSIVSQVCEALQYAHDQGVVHRDIKPGNILLDREGEVKLGDFGLAKFVRSEDSFRLTGTLQAMGTLHYMAPEQLERPLEVDHRADLYSLGVVLYELLTGELPIGRFEVPSKRAGVDVGLDEVVMKTLEKEPDQRYQSASEVQIEVDRASDLVRGGGGRRPRSVSTAGAGDQSSERGAEHYLGSCLLVLSALVFLPAVLTSIQVAQLAAQGKTVLSFVAFTFLLVLTTVCLGLAGRSMRRSDRRRREEGAVKEVEAPQEDRASSRQVGVEAATVTSTQAGKKVNRLKRFSMVSCLILGPLLVLSVLFMFLIPRPQNQEEPRILSDLKTENRASIHSIHSRVAHGRSQDWDKDVELHNAWNSKERRVFNFVGDRFALPTWLIEDLQLSAQEANALEEALRPVREKYERELIAHTDVRVLWNGRIAGKVKHFYSDLRDLEGALGEAFFYVLGPDWRSRNVSGESIQFFRGLIRTKEVEFTFRRLTDPAELFEGYNLVALPSTNIESVLDTASSSMVEVDGERLLTDEKYAYDLRILCDMKLEGIHSKREGQLHWQIFLPRENYWLDNDMRVILAHALGVHASGEALEKGAGLEAESSEITPDQGSDQGAPGPR